VFCPPIILFYLADPAAESVGYGLFKESQGNGARFFKFSLKIQKGEAFRSAVMEIYQIIVSIPYLNQRKITQLNFYLFL
jgi:hypothetical protein